MLFSLKTWQLFNKKIKSFGIKLPFFIIIPFFYSLNFGQNTAITYETFLKHTYHGVPTVALSETIRDEQKMNEYFQEVNFDPQRLTEQPNFDSVMLIAIVSGHCGGPDEFYRKITKIEENTDTIFVHIHDSTVFTPGISFQAGYSVLLVTIPKSSKSVTFYKDTSSVCPKNRYTGKMSTQNGSLKNRARIYDINGRVLNQNSIHDNRLMIQSSRYGNNKFLSFQTKNFDTKQKF